MEMNKWTYGRVDDVPDATKEHRENKARERRLRQMEVRRAKEKEKRDRAALARGEQVKDGENE